jgi:type I restriction enzyme, S subunit
MKEGWVEKKIGDPTLFKIIDGDRGKNYPKQSDFLSEGYCLFLNTKNVRPDGFNFDTTMFVDKDKDEELRKGKLKRRDVILTTRGTIGNVAIYDDSVEFDNIRINSGMLIFRPNEYAITSEYLFKILLSPVVRQQIAESTSGAAQPQLPIKTLVNFTIPVPPVFEQKQIVAILDKVFEGIDKAITNTEKNLTNARELFESYLNEIFTQKGNGWEWVSLSDITTDITDGDHQPPPKSQSGIPFITISNINKQDRKVDFSNTFKVLPEYFEKLKDNRKPRKGDLLYTVTGSYGIPVVVDHDMNFCFQRHIGLIRPNNETNSKCLYYMLLSRHLLNQADECATGTAQKTVSLSGLRRFSVPKIPKEKQEIIVAELDVLSEQICRLESICRAKLAALNELKQSILQKAFTGELTADTAHQTIEAAEEEIAA